MSAIEIINCFTQSITALAASGGIIIIIRQLKLQHDQHSFQALMELHERVGRQDFRDALETIYMAKQEELDEPHSGDLFRKIRMVAALYDLLGAGVQEGLLPKEATLRTEWKVILPLWVRLEGFIKREREHRKLPYKEHFEYLAREAKHYWKTNYPESDPLHRAMPREKSYANRS